MDRPQESPTTASFTLFMEPRMNIAETLSARPIASSNYVAKWGAWEALREITCNAIDADPDRYILDYRGTDTVSIYTTTAPTYHECCVVGEGSKDSETGTIGQFGEGLKLAALTAIRMNGTLSIRTPLFTSNYAHLVRGLVAAVKARYGDKVCLPLTVSNSRKDEYARSLGYTIASDLNLGVLSVLRAANAIPDVDDVTVQPDFKPTPCTITPAQRAGLNRILSAVTAVLALDPSTIELISLLTIDAFDPTKAPPDAANLQCCGAPDNKIGIFLSLSLINDTDATPASVAGSVILGLASSQYLAERFSHKSESVAAHFLGLAAISLLPA